MSFENHKSERFEFIRQIVAKKVGEVSLHYEQNLKKKTNKKTLFLNGCNEEKCRFEPRHDKTTK